MRTFQERRARRRRLARLGAGATGLAAVVAALVIVSLTSAGASFPYGRGTATPHLVGEAPHIGSLPTESIEPSESPSPTEEPTTEAPQPVQPRNEPPPQHPVEPAPGYQGPAATTPAEAVANAASAGYPRASRVAVAVLDRQTGTTYTAGSADSAFASASLVKVFIATRLLVEHQDDDPDIRNLMWQMIVASDDDAASALYPRVGAEDVIPWVASRYNLGGLAPAPVPNYWGLTLVTARAMVNFYSLVANDPLVGGWLLEAMRHAQPTAADGFPQYFGIPSAAAHQWRVKQGWMCCLENLTRMHSTGFIDNDRYTVALLTEGPRRMYGSYGALTLTLMAQALLPNGTLPQPGPPTDPPPTDPPPDPTPTAPVTPTATVSLTPSPSPTTSSPTEPAPTEPSPTEPDPLLVALMAEAVASPRVPFSLRSGRRPPPLSDLDS